MNHNFFFTGAIAVSVFAALTAGPALAGTAQTLCQIEVDEAEIKQPARRPDTVAFIKRSEGQVAVFRRGGDKVEEMPASIGMELHSFDAVVAGEDGAFDLIFTDNSTVTAIANTCLEISEYAYKPAQKEGEFRMRLGRGVVSVTAGEVAKFKGDTMSIKVRNDTNLAVTGTRMVIRAK
ncbi:MAG: hypothetical protein ACPGGK_09800 [Pikeienuella sp.]